MTANCRSKSIADALAFVRILVCVISVACAMPAFAQAPAPQNQAPAPQKPAAPAPAAPQPAVVRPPDVAVPGNYVIGTDDLLGIVYWRDKEMSTDARVRPDGRISLPLINEVHAAGLTPEELQKKITEESKKFMEDASITIVVREINSHKVFITGEVNKPGPYSITSATTVMQLISLAGGLREYANSKNIMIMRKEGDKQTSFKFNYKEVAAGKNLKQNVDLKPGDTVVVP
jgi:polysaccharide export outer membrane protein